MSTCVLKALPGKLDIKRHSPGIFYISRHVPLSGHRIPGLRLLVSSLPGSALKTHVESLGKPRDVNKRSLSRVW